MTSAAPDQPAVPESRGHAVPVLDDVSLVDRAGRDLRACGDHPLGAAHMNKARLIPGAMEFQRPPLPRGRVALRKRSAD